MAVSNLNTMQQLQSCSQYNPDGSCANGTYNSVASAQYNWAGERTSFSYLGFNETRTYNSLLQLSRIQNNNLDIEYNYQAAHNNGRIVQSIDHVMNETVNYSYDALNRLVSAEETTGKWGNAFSYDGWGNMNGQTWTPGYSATPGTITPPGQFQGGAPNWDVENRYLPAPALNGVSPYGWRYDPWGKRVARIYGGADNGGYILNEYYFYGVSGKRMGTYQINVNDGNTYSMATIGTNLYFGGTLIQSNGVTVATDRLGSVRSNANGEKFSYYPYGVERTSTPDGREKFGTYFRDLTLNGVPQDYADQRYYNPNYGTFWSPDPGGLATANPKNPTSWNRYSYVDDDPANFTDAQGLVLSSAETGDPTEPASPSTGCPVIIAGGSQYYVPFCPVAGRGAFLPLNPSPPKVNQTFNLSAHNELGNALSNLSSNCLNVLEDAGIDMAKVSQDQGSIKFYDVSDASPYSQVTLGYIAPQTKSDALLGSLMAGANARTLMGLDIVLLGNNFFGAGFSKLTSQEMGAFLADQGNTLVHEAIHAIDNVSDLQLFTNSVLLNNGLDATGWNTQEDSGAFTQWLDQGCTKK